MKETVRESRATAVMLTDLPTHDTDPYMKEAIMVYGYNDSVLFTYKSANIDIREVSHA